MPPARPDLLDLQIHRYRVGGGTVSTYNRDRGILVIPVMGPEGTPPVQVRVHAPIAVREVEFEYTKQGGPPVFPAPGDTPSGDTILTESLTFHAPITDQSGELVYSVSGAYSYVQADGGRSEGDTFPIDRHPFLTRIDLLGAIPSPQMSPTSELFRGRWNIDGVDTTKLASYGLIK